SPGRLYGTRADTAARVCERRHGNRSTRLCDPASRVTGGAELGSVLLLELGSSLHRSAANRRRVDLAAAGTELPGDAVEAGGGQGARPTSVPEMSAKRSAPFLLVSGQVSSED